MKYYPTLTTEYLIPSILDPRFKKLDFAPEAQQINTKHHYENYLKKKRKITLMARLSKPNVVVVNKVEEYLQLPEIPLESNPLTWWNEKKERFPILSGLARKYLAVSATLTASERLFSDAGNLLTNKEQE
ncbi:1333_t:CDS:2 [Rhizophagus irregularis]|nr:1333_t:CDS:2 [Rhizophagus irregularis]